MLEYAVQPCGCAGVRRDIRAVVLPLFKLRPVLCVPYLAGLGELIPVVLVARVLFQKLHGGLKLLDRILLHIVTQPAQRNIYRLLGQAVAAGLHGGGHDTAVAGHIAREHTAAYLREIVLDGNARLV